MLSPLRTRLVFLMHRVWTLTVLALLATLARDAPAQKLSGVREAVSAPKPSSQDKPKKRRSSRNRDSCCDDDGFFDDLTMLVVTSPFTIPHAMFDDPYAVRFQSYADLRLDEYFHEECRIGDRGQAVTAVRGLVDYGTNFGSLESVGTKLQLDLPLWRLTLDGSITNYFEQLPSGETDSLMLGDANVVFRFAQNERIAWRSGVGVNWLADTHSRAGVNFTYGVDLLPEEPFVFSTEVDLGTLGNASLFRSRTTLGLQWRDIEVYTGYEYLGIDSVDLSTMLFGVRAWW